MNMSVFQFKANDSPPATGKILISSPFLRGSEFARSVVLIIEHNERGSVGILLNKEFPYHVWLNDLLPGTHLKVRIPVSVGGPIDRETLFFVHRFSKLSGAIPIGDGLYINGDFAQVLRYISEGNPTDGYVRFFFGCIGWTFGQLTDEIHENSWLVSAGNKEALLHDQTQALWSQCLDSLGGKYALWARYPQYPSLN
jgi:putative transcriptional regulator